MIYIVFYDIESDRLRKKISDYLISEGFQRIQYSVFVCPAKYLNFDKVYNKLTKIMTTGEASSDKIYIMKAPKDSISHMIILGEFNLDLEELTGEKKSFVF